MADTVTETAAAMVNSCNDLMAKGFSVAGAGREQATLMAKSLAQASQVEGQEAGKAWQELMDYAQTRTGKMTGLAGEIAAMKSFEAIRTSGGIKPETRELVEEAVKSDAGFCKSWAEYPMRIERRQVELMTGMWQPNAALMGSGQEMLKSAFDCGEAFLAWSMTMSKPTVAQ